MSPHRLCNIPLLNAAMYVDGRREYASVDNMKSRQYVDKMKRRCVKKICRISSVSYIIRYWELQILVFW